MITHCCCVSMDKFPLITILPTSIFVRSSMNTSHPSTHTFIYTTTTTGIKLHRTKYMFLTSQFHTRYTKQYHQKPNRPSQIHTRSRMKLHFQQRESNSRTSYPPKQKAPPVSFIYSVALCLYDKVASQVLPSCPPPPRLGRKPLSLHCPSYFRVCSVRGSHIVLNDVQNHRRSRLVYFLFILHNKARNLWIWCQQAVRP